MLVQLLMASILTVGTAPNDLIAVEATIVAGRSGRSSIVLKYTVKEGYTASGAGIPAPILQIDVPDSISLVGKELTTLNDLKRNNFLHDPFEKLLKRTTTRILFTKPSKPDPESKIGLNFLAYVGQSSGDQVWFIRQRLEIGTAVGSTAALATSPNSTWGKGETLNIGDRAHPFTLPRANGEAVALESFLGTKNIIVTTYRAFW